MGCARCQKRVDDGTGLTRLVLEAIRSLCGLAGRRTGLGGRRGINLESGTCRRVYRGSLEGLGQASGWRPSFNLHHHPPDELGPPKVSCPMPVTLAHLGNLLLVPRFPRDHHLGTA